MAELQRSASAVWTGDLRSGGGSVTTQSGVISDTKVTFLSRFENGTGSNPEEMLAAAHASCFSMALSAGLSREGTPPEEIRTKATLTIRKEESGFRITAIHLETVGRVPGIDEATFKQAAEGAKENCPVSKLFKPGLDSLTLDVKLAN